MPVHGYKIGENYWAGQIVKYTCDTGYFMEGPTNRLSAWKMEIGATSSQNVMKRSVLLTIFCSHL